MISTIIALLTLWILAVTWRAVTTVLWYRQAHTMPPRPGAKQLWREHRRYIWQWLKKDFRPWRKE